MFESARLKVERAEHHIAQIKDGIQATLQRGRNFIGFQPDPNTRTLLPIILFGDIPHDLPLIVGDAIHNLRTALDHATWELIGFDGGNQDRWATLPMGDSRVNYESGINGKKTLSPEAREFLISLGHYKGGPGEVVYALHQLDIADKHQILSAVARTSFMPDGIVRITAEYATGPDGTPSFRPPADGPSFEINQNADAAIDVCFGEVEFLPLQPIIPTLMHLRDAVSETIGQFAEFVRLRA